MITVTKSTSDIADVGILLGRQGENEARQIVFDLTWLIDTFGAGTAVLVHQRSKDGAPYIINAAQSNDKLTWTVSNTDTAYDGWGQAELRWTVNSALAKTLIYKTITIRSITAATDIPDPYQSWYDAMIDYIDENSISPEDLDEAIAEYIAEHPISAPVTSVNNKTGDVVLAASDVGALPDDTVIPTVPTNVSAFTNDAGYGTYSKPTNGIPKTDLESAVQTSLGKADSALQSAPVSSVDGKTGTVTVLPSGGSSGQVLKKSSSTDYAVEWGNESGAVSSVDGKTGSVTVLPSGGTSGQVLKKSSSTDYAVEWGNESGAVTSVNNKTGAVTLTASDVGAYALPSGGIPKTDLASAVQTSLGKADSALQSAPVTSVNSKTGAVTLSASDVGAGTYSKPSGGIPASDLASAVQTSLGKADTALQSAPVSSVNSKTGAVVLDAGDLSYDGAETYSSGTVGKEISDVKSDLGDKISAPSSPTTGQFLKWSGSAWVASDLPVYSGGVS